jgi:hypothetical protein
MVGASSHPLGQRRAPTAPVLFRVKRRRGTVVRLWPCANPKIYAVEKPGDLVQLDTLALRPDARPRPKAIHGSRDDTGRVHYLDASPCSTL